MQKLPIIDRDGRLWTWKPQTGYLPETDRARAERKLALRSIRQKGITRDYYSREFAEKLLVAADGYCGICGVRFKKKEAWNRDHVWPRHLGGHNWRNLVPAHYACNSAKGDRKPTGCEILFLEFVNARIDTY